MEDVCQVVILTLDLMASEFSLSTQMFAGVLSEEALSWDGFLTLRSPWPVRGWLL